MRTQPCARVCWHDVVTVSGPTRRTLLCLRTAESNMRAQGESSAAGWAHKAGSSSVAVTRTGMERTRQRVQPQTLYTATLYTSASCNVGATARRQSRQWAAMHGHMPHTAYACCRGARTERAHDRQTAPHSPWLGLLAARLPANSHPHTGHTTHSARHAGMCARGVERRGCVHPAMK
jgi:hypothetical protein